MWRWVRIQKLVNIKRPHWHELNDISKHLNYLIWRTSTQFTKLLEIFVCCSWILWPPPAESERAGHKRSQSQHKGRWLPAAEISDFCRAKFQPPMFPPTCTTSSLRSSRTPWGPLASSQRRRAFQSCQCESSYIPLRIVLLYVLYSFRIKCKIFKTKEDITIKISDQVSALETSALCAKLENISGRRDQ